MMFFLLSTMSLTIVSIVPCNVKSNVCLNFEQSIANEMEAELLLGKNLNLEKARQAAMDNDLVTLAEEIAKNVGDSAEFAEMNRIQQDAAAAAVGAGGCVGRG